MFGFSSGIVFLRLSGRSAAVARRTGSRLVLVQFERALGEFSSPTVKLGLGFSEGALVRDAGSLELCPRGLNLGRGLLKGVEPGLRGLGVRD